MVFSAASLPLLLLLALSTTLALAAPTAPSLVYALQKQLPPVARVNQTFTWTLLPGTFNASAESTITLSTRSLPSWCEFDATTETFSGLPLAANIGSTVVSVTANVTGIAQGRTDSFRLLVVDPAVEAAPYVRLSLADQLESAAAVSGGGTLTPDGALKVPPQWSFSFGFQQYTFQNNQTDKIYYTLYEEGTTSLPSWVTFDNTTVTVGGLAPYTSGEYALTLFGSERYGFGDVQQTLRLTVAEHSFELLGAMEAAENKSTVLPVAQGTPGGPVNYTIPLDDFRIDNSTITATNLSTVTADLTACNLSSYLAFNSKTFTLSGELPFSIALGNLLVPLTFVDQYNSSLQTNLSLVVSTSLFDTSLFPQTIDLQQGKNFSQALSPFFTSTETRKRASTPDATFTATITPTEAAQWLSFSATDLALSGTAPADIPSYGNATVEILATPLDASSAASRAEFIFAIVSSPSNTTTVHPGVHGGLSRSAELGLGLGLGLGGGLLLLCIVAFWLWKKRKAVAAGEGEDERKMRRDASQQLDAYSPNPATVSSVTVVGNGSPREGEKLEEKRTEKGGLAPPIPGAEGMALPLHQRQQQPQAKAVQQQQQQGAKRFDMMGIFRSESGWSMKSKKGKGATKEDVSYPRPPLPQQSSLFGLGIDDDDEQRQQHQVVVIDGEGDGRRMTYREHSDPAAILAVHRAETPNSGGSGSGSGRRGPGRVSSWESGGSSSLFYSERSIASPVPSSRDSNHTGSPTSSGRSRTRANRPPSIPFRRRDFLPIPLNSPTASPNASPVPSPTRDTYDVTGTNFYAHRGADTSLERDDSQGGSSGSGGGIRIVGSHSESNSGSNAYTSHPSDLDASASRHPLPHLDCFQQYSSPSHSGSPPSQSHSDESLPAPRLMPFAPARPSPQFVRTVPSQSSLRARGLDPNAFEDADEDELENGEWAYDEGPSGVSAVSSTRRQAGIRPRSGVYVPEEGEPETSFAYYPSEPDSSQEYPQARETWRSQSGFADSVYSLEEEDGMRYVGSVASTSVAPSPFLRDGRPTEQQQRGSGSSYQPPTPRSDLFHRSSVATTATTPTSAAFRHSADSPSRPSYDHKRGSSFHDPIRVPLTVNIPFRFTPRLASPPFVSITSSPGRGGPPRATYRAFIEGEPATDDDEEELLDLPSWLHFDGAAMEVFGLARRQDVGTHRLVVLERKEMRPGSPTRGGSSVRDDVTEQVVGRFEMNVALREDEGESDWEDEGELRIVTF